jgi:hypothetical protein
MIKTNSINVAPILDLITARDLSIPIKGMYACIARDLDICWVAGQDDGHAGADFVSINLRGLPNLYTY